MFQSESPSEETLQERSSPRSKSGVLSVGTSRDEMNLAEFPLAVLSTRSNPNVKTLVFKDSQRMKNGEIIEREWIITGADKFGLPTATDDDVVLGLMRLSMGQGFRERKIYFTRYELLRALRWSTEGRSYTRLSKSLDRLSGVRIRAANAFFDNSSKGYQTRNFGIIDAYELNDERGKGEGKEPKKSFFIWSEVLFSSFQSGFIKKLDLGLYFELKSAVSRRLYRYLDKHFYYRDYVEKNLMHFAFEKLGLSRTYKFVSSVKQQLEPACEELVRMGFLERIEYSGRGDQTLVRFYPSKKGSLSSKGAQQVLDQQPVEQRREAAPVEQPLQNRKPLPLEVMAASQSDPRLLVNSVTESLLSRGISLSQAGRLLAGRTLVELKKVERIIQYYDFLVESGDQKVSRNRVGFLYRAVETPERFVVPERFGPEGCRENVSRRKRPELRVYRAEDDAPQLSQPRQLGLESLGDLPKGGSERARYDEERKNRLSAARRQHSLAELQRRAAAAVRRLEPVRKVVGEEQFKRLVSQCVEDEILQAVGFPTFEEWSAKV